MIDLQILSYIIVIVLSSIAISTSLINNSINKNNSILIAVYLGLLILVSVFISNIFSKSIIPTINNNISFIMTIIGMVLIYTGYRFILDFKIKSKKSIERKYPKIIYKINEELSLILLFFSYYVAILINIIYVAPSIWLSIFELGLISVGISIILIIVSYFILYRKIRTPKRMFNGIFGFFLMLSGILYFTLYMFVPNLQSVLSQNMTPLSFPETNMMIYILIIVFISVAFGFVFKKSKRFRNLF